MRRHRARHAPLKFGYGVGTLSLVDERGVKTELARAYNTWMYSWGTIAARLFGRGDLAYVPSSFYVEFCNGTAAGSVAVPTVTRADGVGYYQGLSGSSTLDYLRVPFLLQPGVDVDPAYTSYLAAGAGNRLSYHALTTGTAGVNGKPFSNAAGSVVYGLAVVATPVPNDRTQDVVWNRMYYATSKQTAVPAAGQLSVDMQLTFP